MDKEKLALALIELVYDNTNIIDSSEIDDYDINKFYLEKSSEKYDTFSKTYYHTRRLYYNNSFVPVDSLKSVKKETFVKEIRTRDKIYLVNLSHKESAVFIGQPIFTGTSINDFLASIKYTKKGISAVELTIYRNAGDRNLTYDSFQYTYKVDHQSLMEVYNNIDYSTHTSPYIHKEIYKYF